MSLSVEKKIHLKAENDKPVSVVAITYCSMKDNELIEVISLGELGRGYLWRRSEDNGKTWENFEPTGIPQIRNPVGGTKVVSHWQSGLFRDDTKEVLIAGWLKATMDESIVAWKDAEGLSTRKMYYQISSDGGLSWSKLYPDIEKEYDKNNWPDGIGCYAGYVDFNQGCKVNDDMILFPSHKMRYFPETQSISDKNGLWWIASSALQCKWDNSHLDCAFGSWITVGRDKSMRGLDEPTLVKLTDGRILMILRGSKPKENFPGVKFYSVSDDNGLTWSEPAVLTYEDGKPMYSPSSMIKIFQWNAGNGIYLITNILDSDEIIRGCDPRYPLQIAKINENTLCVEKDSITIIENRRPEQAANIRFSNFCVIEDKQTGSLRVYMTACPGDVGKKPGDNVPLDSYEYIISLT